MVENIEELTPELQVYGFSNLGVFYHRKIEVVESRPPTMLRPAFAEGRGKLGVKTFVLNQRLRLWA